MALPIKLLSVAANTSTAGVVLLIQGKLKYWQNSRRAVHSPADAKATVKNWIETFSPHVVVTEKLTETSRKSERTKAAIRAMAASAEASGVISLPIPRPKEYKNKYVEAVALATRYPVIRPWVPKRKFYDPEPKNVVLFEALALANTAECNLAVRIAARLG